MIRSTLTAICTAIAFIFLMPCPGSAADSQAVNVWPGVAPGSDLS
jgi:hypothetical protein